MPKITCTNSNGSAAKISYRQVGVGPDVILIHGLAANCAFWQMDLLAPLCEHHRVTIYDLRGHGYSEMTDTGYRPPEMAEDLLSLMDQLAVNKATLVGHSFGGDVTLNFVTKYPQRVENLVLADTRVHVMQPSNYAKDWPNAAEAMPKLRELGLDIPEDEKDSGIWLLEQLAKPEWRAIRHKLKGSPLYMPFGPWGGGGRSADKWLQLLNTTQARKDFASIAGPGEEQLRRIQQKALVYYGSHSTLQASFEGLKRLLPNCTALVAQNGGHFFPLSQPKTFGAEVSSFLSRCENDKAFAPRRADVMATGDLTPQVEIAEF